MKSFFFFFWLNHDNDQVTVTITVTKIFPIGSDGEEPKEDGLDDNGSPVVVPTE